MIIAKTYKNQKVAVLGLGKTGMGAIYSLLAAESDIIIWDDGENSRNVLPSELQPLLVHPTDDRWQRITCLVVSPGVPLTHEVVLMARKLPCEVVSDIELLYAERPKAQYIGVTGTNGKSTTTSLIAHILASAHLSHQIGGNIGVSVLALEPLQVGHYVLETSSYQLELLNKVRFNIAILLNITPDHLERHVTMENYIAAKMNIFRNSGPGDVAIIGIDNPVTFKIYQTLLAEGKISKIIPISTKQITPKGVSIIDNILYNNIAEPYVVELGQLQYLPGQHNQENIAASIACGTLCDVGQVTSIEAVRSFKGLAHRLQYLATKNNITFINDSKATNAEATEKALLSFENIYWLAGGVAKDVGITTLAPYFPRVKQAFLFGQASAEFAGTLEGHTHISVHADLASAFAAAFAAAAKDPAESVLLLSPACASFDQWLNFEKRGEAFCQMVAQCL
jgi:UDP-N-acetylmuramoylalanine--D-glutamate ligase